MILQTWHAPCQWQSWNVPIAVCQENSATIHGTKYWKFSKSFKSLRSLEVWPDRRFETQMQYIIGRSIQEEEEVGCQAIYSFSMIYSTLTWLLFPGAIPLYLAHYLRLALMFTWDVWQLRGLSSISKSMCVFAGPSFDWSSKILHTKVRCVSKCLNKFDFSTESNPTNPYMVQYNCILCIGIMPIIHFVCRSCMFLTWLLLS